MPISSALAARLSSVSVPASVRRWSPYARPSAHEARGGPAEVPRPRPSLRLNSTAKRLLDPTQKAAPSGSGCRSDVASSVAAAAAPAQRRPGFEMTNQEPKPKPNLAEGDEKPGPRPSLRLNSATTRLLDPTQNAAPSGSGRRPGVASSVAAAAAPAPRRPGCKMTNQRPKPNLPERDERPRPRPSLRLNSATTRLLDPTQKAAPSGSGRRSEVASSVAAAAAAPAPRCPGCEMKNQEPKPNPAEGDEKPPAEEKRGCGGGGFVFHCTLAGHTEAISGISLPLGSDKLYSGSADGSVRVWDCNSGKCVDVIEMGGKIGCMITHGPWVFMGIPKSVEAWNTQNGMKLSLQGPSGLVCSMTITNEMLFAGTGDGSIMAWDFSSKKINVEPVAILSGHERAVITLSASATSLLSGSLDKTIKVWDLTTLHCVETLSEHKAAVTSVLCWDQKLLSCSLDKTVKVWTLSESGTLQVQHTHAEEHGLRTLFGMHRAGKTPVLFCSLRNSNCIHLFNLPSFHQMGTLFCKKEVRTIELADVGLLFTGDYSGELKVWRWAPQELEAASAAHSESPMQRH